MNLRLFSQVQAAGLILPRKAKYTVRDCRAVQVASLFRGGPTLTNAEASFVVRCSAAHWGTEFSAGVRRYAEYIF